MKKLVVLAIFLRLLVAAFYFHPDIKTIYFQTSFLKQGVTNIYTHLVGNKETLPLKEEFVYFPLTYFTLGSYQWLAQPLFGRGFDSWLANAGVNSFVKDSYVFRYLTLMKLPFLLVDIGIAFLLMKFFEDRKRANKAFVFWLFNPFTIVLFYVFSNVDIFPIALTLLSFLAAKKNKLILSSLLLGVAAGFKLYPILFIPFLALKGKDVKDRLLILAAPALVVLAIMLPFVSQAFINSAVISGLTTRIFNPGFSLGFGEAGITGLIGATALFFWTWLVDEKKDLFGLWIALFLIIFSFSHFHIQWLGWVAPFLVITSVEKPKLATTIFVLSCIAFLIPPLYDDRSMTLGVLRTYSTMYDLIPTPFVAIQRFYDPLNLQSILHSILAGGSLVTVYKLLKA